MTLGPHEQPELAGALPLAPGKRLSDLGARKNPGLFRALLPRRDTASPASDVPRLSVVVDHYWLHQAQAGTPWWARPPRCEGRWLPSPPFLG